VIFNTHPWNSVRPICVSDDVFWDSANDCKGKHHKCGLKINKGMYTDVQVNLTMVTDAYYVITCMMSQWEFYKTIGLTTKFPLQGSLTYILLSYQFILNEKQWIIHLVMIIIFLHEINFRLVLVSYPTGKWNIWY